MPRSFFHVAANYSQLYDEQLKVRIDERQYGGYITGLDQCYSCSFSPDGKLLAIGVNYSPRLIVLRTDTWDRVNLVGGNPNGSVMDIAFSPDGSKVACAAASSSNSIEVYESEMWGKLPIVGGANLQNGAQACAFSPDNAFLAVGHYELPYLTIYRTSDWSKVVENYGITSRINSLKYSPDGSMLACCNINTPYFTLLNTSDWSKIPFTTAMSGFNSATRCCAFSQSGRWLAVTWNNSPNLAVFNTSDWSKITLNGGTPFPSGVNGLGVAFNHDDTLLGAVCSGDSNSVKKIALYDTATWEKLPAFEINPSGHAWAIAFSPPLIGGEISNLATTPIQDAIGAPAQRRVVAMRRDLLTPLQEVVSDADGRYVLPMIKNDKVMVCFQAESEFENSIVYDWVKPE